MPLGKLCTRAIISYYPATISPLRYFGKHFKYLFVYHRNPVSFIAIHHSKAVHKKKKNQIHATKLT